MKLNRRKFITTAGAVAAGALVVPQWSCKNEGGKTAGNIEASSTDTIPESAQPSLTAFGIQLYTVRDVIPGDPKAVMKELANFGYTQFESFEHPKQGMFWGMEHTAFKAYMDEIGVELVSSHCDTSKNFEKKAGQAGEIGMKYLVSPWVGPQKKMDDWKKIADEFNRLGGICKQNGLRFAYHNHGYSFVGLEGVIPQDYLIENTDPELVDFEMDLYWVVTAGADPGAYLQKYPNRWRLCHVKDRLKGASPDQQDASCDLGTGSLDFPEILKTARANGMQFYIVEQERYDNSSSMDSAKVDAAYMKQLVF